MIQTWTEWSKVYPADPRRLPATPRKPIVHGEPRLRERPGVPTGTDHAALVRRQAWWALHGGRLLHLRPGHACGGWATGWTETVRHAGSRQMGVFRGSRPRVPGGDVPDQGLFASGVGCERTLNTALRVGRRRAARSSTFRRQCWVRCTSTRSCTRAFGNAGRPTQRQGARTGVSRRPGTFPSAYFRRSRTQWFSVPGHWEDAVLILDAVD